MTIKVFDVRRNHYKYCNLLNLTRKGRTNQIRSKYNIGDELQSINSPNQMLFKVSLRLKLYRIGFNTSIISRCQYLYVIFIPKIYNLLIFSYIHAFLLLFISKYIFNFIKKCYKFFFQGRGQGHFSNSSRIESKFVIFRRQ